jgi:hypothetical protein
MSRPTDAQPPAQSSSGKPSSDAIRSQTVREALSGDVLPAESIFRRAEDKPPLYRFFRGGIYVGYMLVVVWFCASILLAAFQSVWGAPGDAVRARESQARPLTAAPEHARR